MILDYKYFRPVKVAGIFFIIASAVCGILYLSVLNDPRMDLSFHIFILVNFYWHLLTGIGILQQKIWGFYLLKIYVYFLTLGFPIGTYYGVKSLRYLREKSIKNFFAKQAIDT